MLSVLGGESLTSQGSRGASEGDWSVGRGGIGQERGGLGVLPGRNMNGTMAEQQEAGVIGFAAMVARGGREVMEASSVARELGWQREVKGEQGRITLFME